MAALGVYYAPQTWYDGKKRGNGRKRRMEKLGLYVHIPFCARKCAYCDFASWPNRTQDMERYAGAVCDEIARRGREYGRPQADTVFFGGGTPSLLPPALFERIARALRRHFDVLPGAEWTVECNPGTVKPEFAAAMRENGVNRVSMGMQAAQPELLRKLGRIHTMEEVGAAAECLRRAGIGNLNLDLMLGLPGQTRDDMAQTLRAALALRPEHVSCYALIVEEGTPLYEWTKTGQVTLPDEDSERAMYELCRDTLRANGFHQYEISNFAREGRECRHNVNCWQREDYLGFGCAAHSLRNNERRANPRGLDAYLAGEAPQCETVSADEAMFESVMLGLRLTRGMEEADFLRRHGRALWEVYGAGLSRALADGRLRREDGRVFLTAHGMDVMNSVLLEIM